MKALRSVEDKCDILHLHLPFPALVALLPFVPSLLPWVVSLHNEVQHSVLVFPGLLHLHDLLLRRLLSRASAVIVSTRDYADSCTSLRHLDDVVRIIPHGIDHALFSPAIGTMHPATPDHVLFVGRLSYYKGVHLLLEALARLPEVQLRVVGDGPERASLRRQATALRVDRQVEWLGPVEDSALPGLYRAAAALVLPSTGASESFGLVQVEAHLCGTPVISSSLPGVREVNRHEVTGLLVEPGNVDDLVAAISRIVESPPLRASLGEQAVDATKDAYTLGRMCQDVEELYLEVLRRGP